MFNKILLYLLGILLATCDNGWREQRRFCVSTLKKLGMGKKTLEKTVGEEATYLCADFKSQEGTAYSCGQGENLDLVYSAIGNIISTLTFGYRFEYHNENFMKLMHLTEEIMKEGTKILPQLMANISWLSYIPGPQQKFKKNCDDFGAIVKEIVNEHKKTRDPTIPRDFIDAFLVETEKFDITSQRKYDHSLIILNGLTFSERVHEEVDAVIGRVKSPTMEDRSQLPYTTAVIHEIQRWADIVPMTFPYMTHKDIEVGEFVIPKVQSLKHIFLFIFYLF
ncbi:hypothetical protein JD844_028253 [Phrynosoma platyrhinos]|uniref:Uncharacterized protein n=1 Tax=Phrynosoma platyrhinos TaxID=52577 RepID=A0ABQ7SHM5_PHRPL|nr:hypothetical protein JD844_028253 [Phrynosoma platyrhinos]